MLLFEKKLLKNLVGSQKVCTFAPANKEITLECRNGGSVAQLNRASDYGSEGCGFESRRNHKTIERLTKMRPLYLCYHFIIIFNFTQISQISQK